MNFFEHQDRSLKKTKWLVVLFVLAVLCIIAAVYGAAMSYQVFACSPHDPRCTVTWWDPNIFAIAAVSTIAVIAGGSIFMISKLGAGGRAVASMLGGQQISPSTKDPKERQVLNVIEEMAIASGTPVPEVFLLPSEDSINAFAAGFTPSDAVIGITRGAANQLTRDELQGVVAHEFSHILHGDMRLNIRLMGVVFGILVIAMIGEILMRTARGGGRKKGSNPLPLLGLALFIIGYIGVFFGNLIKAAVSRQREFLADASAVQYTRNPRGIGGALSKIANHTFGSKIRSAYAKNASHIFFENALKSSFLSLLNTHPPIDERLRRIDETLIEKEPVASPLPKQPFIERVGTTSHKNIQLAHDVVTATPLEVMNAAHDAAEAQLLIYALLSISGTASPHFEPLQTEKGRSLLERARNVNISSRLSILEISIPALKTLPKDDIVRFLQNVARLIRHDGKLSTFEFVVTKLLQHHLAPALGKVRKRAVKFKSAEPLVQDARILLSALAQVERADPDHALAAYERGIRNFTTKSLPMLSLRECGPEMLDAPLERMAYAAPHVKETFLASAVKTILADQEKTPAECELLRAIANTIDCPTPPLL